MRLRQTAPTPLITGMCVALDGIITSLVEVGTVVQFQLFGSSQSLLVPPTQLPKAEIVIELVAVIIPQGVPLLIELVTVYVPGVLAAKFTCPVEVLTKTNPVVDENVPATPPPLNTGLGLTPFGQYGLPV